MKKRQAEQILAEAGQDKRLRAALNTKLARMTTDQGFRVDLTLRSRRLSLTVRSPHEWEDIKLAWEGL